MGVGVGRGGELGEDSRVEGARSGRIGGFRVQQTAQEQKAKRGSRRRVMCSDQCIEFRVEFIAFEFIQ